MQLRVALVAAGVVGVVGIAGTRVAAADGSLTMRGVYYKEKSTRVIQPMMDGLFDIGERGVLAAHFLVDAITSASAGSGAANATPFTERRYEGGIGYTHAWDRLRLGGDTKYSQESDYTSFFVGGHGELDLAQKNAMISAGGGASIDKVSAASAQGPSTPTIACNPLDLQDQATSCPLHVYSGYVTGSQILGRNALVSLTYDVSVMHGYQANPYRLVVASDGLVPERHPDSRTRQAVAVSARYYIASSETSVIGAYRYYTDDWKIRAHTPELRVVQEVGANADASIRVRYYTQTAAFFFEPRYTTSDPAMQPYLTDDPKMSAFTGQIYETKLGVFGREFSLGGKWAGARFEGILEYIVQNNRFGNAVEAQVALTLPFVY